MSPILDAKTRCESYGLDPNEAFKSQYIIAPIGTIDMPGMVETPANKWALVHGHALHPMVLEDEKDRVFGIFFGHGVDANGEAVGTHTFKRFNCKGRSFEADLEDYLSGIAGRFVMFLDSGAKTRVYRDPMGHMPLFYNSQIALAGSSVYLTVDGTIQPNRISARPGDGVSSMISVFPMGQTGDQNVRLLPGNHVLDLADFTAHRGWPLRNSIRKVTAAKSAPVIDKLAMRIRSVVQGLIDKEPVILPLDASVGSRMLLAAAGHKVADLAQLCVFQTGGPDDMRNLDIAGMLAQQVGAPLTILDDKQAVEAFGDDRILRQDRKRQYWLRTSSAMRVPAEAVLGIDALPATQHPILSYAGVDALQAGWQIGEPTPKPVRANKTAEISAALAGKPEKATRDAVEEDYERWKSSLPKTLQSQAEDFMRIELHEPPKAVATLGRADHPCVSPFSDREVIELALKLPFGLRAGDAFAESVIIALDEKLADLPYDSVALKTAAE